MTPDEFRFHGQVLIDWVADYVSQNQARPVCSTVQHGQIRAALPASPPAVPEGFAEVWRDFRELILPGITHWQSPNFFAYFPCNNSLPSILGELLSAGLGVQGMLWSTSPACTELETHVLDWVVELLQLPDAFLSSGLGGGVIQDSASSASLCALLAARSVATDGADKREGAPSNLVAYCSDQAHSSIDKAAIIAGIGLDRLRKIPSDADYRMSPQALAAAIAADRAAGLVPFLVVATQGTTSSGACDPLPEIGRLCQTERLWLHVDGAMMGTAACCEEFREINAGMAYADSYCFNPHKWMMVNFDCNCFYVRDRRALVGAMNVDPEYLRNTASASGEVIDYRDWQVPLGRRFRALKLWFVLRSFGADEIAARVRRHVQLAETFATWVHADPQFELVTPRNLNLVCFAHADGDAATERVMRSANATGQVFLTHTRLRDRFTLRLCVGQTQTGPEHVQAAWQLLKEFA
ncbi:MAG: pyridoxal-dependent decarboxylase [Planctomycetota bacterium]